MIGLGTVLGASVLVGVLIYILSKISFVPIVGEFVEDIIGQIETTQEIPQVEETFNDHEETKMGVEVEAPAE